MNILLDRYFSNLEKHLVSSADLASATSTDNTERGSVVEDFVGQLLASHLPRRATVAKHRQIVGADSTTLPRDGYGPSQPVDLVVYNDWTTTASLVESGYVLAESVYLALEVKARAKEADLVKAISRAVRKQLPPAKVIKRLRPETTFFGNMRAKGELPLLSARTSRPTYGILGLLWGESHGTIDAPRCLKAISRTLTGASRLQPWNWPDVIYVPANFLAFKIFTKMKDPHGGTVATREWEDEYPFIPRQRRWPTNDLPLKTEFPPTGMAFGYCCADGPPNLLYTFLFWLAQEVLKFMLEMPDYHRYLLPLSDDALVNREGAAMTPQGLWKVTHFKGDAWHHAR